VQDGVLSINCKGVSEDITEFLGREFSFAVLGDLEDLDWPRVESVAQARVRELEVQHTEEYIEQGLNNLRRLTPAPNSRKSEHADEIINAALEALNLLDRIFGLHFHISGRRG
jgi:hypothetical protein